MKKMIVALMVLAAMLSAAIVDVDRAQKVAVNYYQNYAPESAKGNTVRQVLTKEYMNQPTWYVFNFTKGFVIVAADDAVKPILGYDFEGWVDEDIYNMQNPFVHRFSFYDRYIVHDVRVNELQEVGAKNWKDFENNVFPRSSKAIVVPALCPVNYDQGWPFDNLTPAGCPVGCVATAMHMIMRTHQGPAAPAGSHSYNDIWGSTTGTHNVTYAGTTYDWASILHIVDYGDVSTQAEEDELAMVSYHAGVAVDMDYETDGSGAYTNEVDEALETYFGFDSGGASASLGTPTDPTQNASIIQGNLDNGWPLQWGGQDATYGGHSFVVDGYTDDYYYHFNYGWSGSSNGWYQITNIQAGTANFSSSQTMVYNLWVNGDVPPAPQNVAGTLSNGEDVNITWDAPAKSKYGTLDSYNIYRDDELIANVPLTPRSYDDNDLSSGSYLYYVKGVYVSPDAESLVSNAYQAQVVPDENYPIPTALSATTMGRTSIDLTWSKPYTAQIFWSCNFETLVVETDWQQWQTLNYPPTGAKIGKTQDTMDRNDPVANGYNSWFQCDESSFGDPKYIHDGTYSMATGYTTGGPDDDGAYTWAHSPEFTLSSASELRYWHWLYGNSTYQTYYYVNLYDGDFSETDSTPYCHEIYAFEDVGVTEATNEYETEVVFDLTGYTGTYRLAFVYYYTDGYQMAIDDIIIGSTAKSAPRVSNVVLPDGPRERHATGTPADLSNIVEGSTSAPKADEPTSYDIYRNGAYVTNVAVTGATEAWSDTGFADGVNEYFIKAQFPTGTSIASTRDYAVIYENPAPAFLDGVANGTTAELTWYAPFHLPPHWFGYTDDEFESYFDYIEGMETSTWNERRTTFTASGLGLGYAYPFTVDSLAAAFYDGTGSDWTGTAETFTYEFWTTNTAGDADSILFTSTSQTAVSGYWHNLVLDQQYTMNWGWYVSLHVSDLGYPSSFVNFVESTHSVVYIGAPYDGWYNITYGDGQNGDWAILCYGQGSVDDWYYNKGEAPVENLTLTPSAAIKGTVKPVLDPTTQNNKAMLQYNIYRDGNPTPIASTTNTFYNDTGLAGGDYEYEITAEYTSPAGESDPCTSVIVHIDGATLVAPDPITSAVIGSDVQFSWDAVSGATDYNVYSSATAYGTFSLVGNTSGATSYQTTTSDKMFYYFTSTDAKTAAPKTIHIAKPSSSR